MLIFLRATRFLLGSLFCIMLAFSALITGTSIAGIGLPQTADCDNADPASELAGVAGDFELHADPQDPSGNLIYISNVDSGPSSVVAALLDGQTGKVMAGSLTTIANNFDGDTSVNGPEFVQPPTGGLGLIYRGSDGVHGVFRNPAARAWNDFSFDVAGAPTGLNAPVLPSTAVGAYDAGGLPLGEYTYTQIEGNCQGRCFAMLRWGVTTDAVAVLARFGLAVPLPDVSDISHRPITQSPRDGYIYFTACDASNACGLYEAAIDGVGGFVANTLQMLATVPGVPRAPTELAAARHPVTGTIVLFSNGTNGQTNTIDVWEQPSFGGPLTLLHRVAVVESSHYRVRTSPTELVLNYFVRHGKDSGSYTITVAAPGNRLKVGRSTGISTHASGSKFEWLPAANRFAIYFRTSRYPDVLKRCWVTP